MTIFGPMAKLDKRLSEELTDILLGNGRRRAIARSRPVQIQPEPTPEARAWQNARSLQEQEAEDQRRADWIACARQGLGFDDGPTGRVYYRLDDPQRRPCPAPPAQ